MDRFDNGPVRRRRNGRRGLDAPPEKKASRHKGGGIGFFALEPRILYDAAAAASAGDPHNAADHAAADKIAASEAAPASALATPGVDAVGKSAAPALQPLRETPAAGTASSAEAKSTSADAGPNSSNSSSSGAPAHEIVIIDSTVPDLHTLIAGVRPGDLVFVLDPTTDGVQQIADIIASNHLHDLAAIQIVSHGGEGEVRLGATTLTDGNLASHAAALSQIGAALSPGGDI